MVEIVSLLPWGLCFTGGILTVLYLGERSNWTDARYSLMMACAIILPTPLLYFQVAAIIRNRGESVRRTIESGALHARVPACSRCGYILLGISRRQSGAFTKTVCPECGDLTLLGNRDVRTLELYEAAATLDQEPPAIAIPSPPASP